MPGRTVTYIVTPIPLSVSDMPPSTTTPPAHLIPQFQFPRTVSSNFLTTAQSVPDLLAPVLPGSLWPDASPSTTGASQTLHPSSDLLHTSRPCFPPVPGPQLPPATQVATIIVTVTPTPPSSISATSTSGMPTEFLSQVPKGWPYTEFGVGRGGEVTTWGLTDGEGRLVAEVRHRLMWWPRPLWTGENGTQGLAGWRPTFAVPEGWVVPLTSSSSSTSISTSEWIGTSVASSTVPLAMPSITVSTAALTVPYEASSTAGSSSTSS